MQVYDHFTKALHGLPQDLHIFEWVSSRKVFDGASESFLLEFEYHNFNVIFQ